MAMPKLPTIPDIVKYPLQSVVYLLLAYFVFKEFTRTDPCADLRKSDQEKSKRIAILEEKVDQLTYAVAVKSGVLDRVIQQKKDSLNNVNHENSN